MDTRVRSYLLEFDDDEQEDGSLPIRSVAFNRVVAFPEDHRQWAFQQSCDIYIYIYVA